MHAFMRLSGPVQGMLASALAFLLFSISDVVLKTLTQDYHFVTLAFFAAIGAIVFYNVYALATRQWKPMMATRSYRLHLLRGLCFAGIYSCFLYGITNLPLANIYTLSFTMPFITTLLALMLLKEIPTRREVICLIVGFIGVVVALRPGDWTLSLPVFAGLAMGLFFGVINIIVRFYPKDENWLSMAMFPLYVEFAIYLLASLFIPGVFAVMPLGDALVCALGGVIGGVGLILMNYGFQKASMAQASAFHYMQLIWGALFGWLFFSDALDIYIAAGALLIMAGGMWMLMEKDKKGAA